MGLTDDNDFLLLDYDDYDMTTTHQQQVNETNDNNDRTSGRGVNLPLSFLQENNDYDNERNDNLLSDAVEEESEKEAKEDEQEDKVKEKQQEQEEQQGQQDKQKQDKQDKQKQQNTKGKAKQNEIEKKIDGVTTNLMPGGGDGTIVFEDKKSQEEQTTAGKDYDNDTRWIVVANSDPKQPQQKQHQDGTEKKQNAEDNEEKEESCAPLLPDTLSIPTDNNSVHSFDGMSALTINTHIPITPGTTIGRKKDNENKK